jgi:hypothetical protein
VHTLLSQKIDAITCTLHLRRLKPTLAPYSRRTWLLVTAPQPQRPPVDQNDRVNQDKLSVGFPLEAFSQTHFWPLSPTSLGSPSVRRYPLYNVKVVAHD